ncbi:hypothetical protein BOTBODRAFT_49829, partial [Botryobasidium botryosum FD-172 SS1]
VVELEDLNKPLPPDLKFETRRLTALAKNTLVKYGFSSEDYVAVPDAEEEQNIPIWAPNISFEPEKDEAEPNMLVDEVQQDSWNGPTYCQDSSPLKRKGKDKESNLVGCSPLKKVKLCNPPLSIPAVTFSESTLGPFPGCKWDSSNWSCAYDAVLMIFFSIYFYQDQSWRGQFHQQNRRTAILATGFDHVLSSAVPEPHQLDLILQGMCGLMMVLTPKVLHLFIIQDLLAPPILIV